MLGGETAELKAGREWLDATRAKLAAAPKKLEEAFAGLRTGR